MLKGIRAFLGYLWAIALILVVLATFIGNSFFAKRLVMATGLKISPRLTGGEVIETIEHSGYQTSIHRPVFDGLLCERSTGFVQVSWKSTGRSLPHVIDELIDYNHDGVKDFRVVVNTQTAQVSLNSDDPTVIDIDRQYKLKNERVIRIKLKKKKI